MKMDASVDKFALDPTQYLLKIEGNVIKAERKGLLTWVKAHFPLAIFGDYKLQRVVSLIDKDASEQLKRSINNAIFRFNLVHPESRLSFIEFAPKQPPEALKLPEPFSQPKEEVNPSLIRKLENETPPAEVRNVQENMLAKAIETPLPESPATPKPDHN